jgi:hypothetical protein
MGWPHYRSRFPIMGPGTRPVSLAAAAAAPREIDMSNNPSERLSEEPVDGPVDRPDGSIDDDSVHPLTDPDDDSTGNIDPVVPLGNAQTGDRTEGNQAESPPQDARLMGPAGS